MLIIHGIFVGLFLALGVVFFNGKGSFLIAGYNTASKAEKEKIDEKKLCGYMGKLMFAFAGCFLILMAGDILGETRLVWLGLVLFFGVGIGGLIYINTGNRLKR